MKIVEQTGENMFRRIGNPKATTITLHLLKVCYTLGGFHYFYGMHSLSLCGVEGSVCCLQHIVCCKLTLAAPAPTSAVFGCPGKCSTGHTAASAATQVSHVVLPWKPTPGQLSLASPVWGDVSGVP